MTLYDQMLDYLRTVGPDSDVEELLRFSAEVYIQDQLLGTLPINFYSVRANVNECIRVARRLRDENEDFAPFFGGLRECLACNSNNESEEYRFLFYRLAVEVAEAIGDEDARREFARRLRDSRGYLRLDDSYSYSTEE